MYRVSWCSGAQHSIEGEVFSEISHPSRGRCLRDDLVLYDPLHPVNGTRVRDIQHAELDRERVHFVWRSVSVFNKVSMLNAL